MKGAPSSKNKYSVVFRVSGSYGMVATIPLFAVLMFNHILVGHFHFPQFLDRIRKSNTVYVSAIAIVPRPDLSPFEKPFEVFELPKNSSIDGFRGFEVAK